MAAKPEKTRLLQVEISSVRQFALFVAAALAVVSLAVISMEGAIAQNQGFELTPLERKHLLMIAREAAEAHLDGRLRRQLLPNPRLERRQGLAVSYYSDDGRLLRRAWRLAQAWEMTQAAADLSVKAGFEPDGENPPLTSTEARSSRIRVSVLSDYVRITAPDEIGPQDAVVVLWGFKEGLALPGDTTSAPLGRNMLESACLSIGLNSQTWRLDEATLFKAKLHETTEAPGGPARFYNQRRQ